MSISVVSTAYANSGLSGGAATVTAPTTISSGNLLVGVISSGTTTYTLPTGWTLYQTVASMSGAPQVVIAYKYAGSSEPASYTFTPAATGTEVIATVLNLSGTDPGTPFNNAYYSNYTTATASAGTGGANNGGSSTPSQLNCLPIAVWSIQQLNPSNTGAPTALTSGWTGRTFNVASDSSNPGNTNNGNGYDATYIATGPLTSSTSSAVSASVTWAGGYSNFASSDVLLLVNPATAGNITITPSSITIPGPGQTATATVSQAGSTSTLTVSSSNTSIFTVSPSSLSGGSGTVTLTGVAAGTVTGGLIVTSPV